MDKGGDASASPVDGNTLGGTARAAAAATKTVSSPTPPQQPEDDDEVERVRGSPVSIYGGCQAVARALLKAGGGRQRREDGEKSQHQTAARNDREFLILGARVRQTVVALKEHRCRGILAGGVVCGSCQKMGKSRRCGGFYDPKKRRIVLCADADLVATVGGMADTLAHELIHAFDV